MPQRRPRPVAANSPIRPGTGPYPDPLLFLADDDNRVQDNIVEKVNAGARLTYALYMHPNAKDLFASPYMTRSLLNAYMAAAKAWGI